MTNHIAEGASSAALLEQAEPTHEPPKLPLRRIPARESSSFSSFLFGSIFGGGVLYGIYCLFKDSLFPETPSSVEAELVNEFNIYEKQLSEIKASEEHLKDQISNLLNQFQERDKALMKLNANIAHLLESSKLLLSTKDEREAARLSEWKKELSELRSALTSAHPVTTTEIPVTESCVPAHDNELLFNAQNTEKGFQDWAATQAENVSPIA